MELKRQILNSAEENYREVKRSEELRDERVSNRHGRRKAEKLARVSKQPA
jgi:hypothetical protein